MDEAQKCVAELDVDEVKKLKVKYIHRRFVRQKNQSKMFIAGWQSLLP